MKAFKSIGKMVGNLDLNKGVAAVIAAFGVLGSIIVGLVESAKGCKEDSDVVEGEADTVDNPEDCDLLNHNQAEEQAVEPADSDEK